MGRLALLTKGLPGIRSAWRDRAVPDAAQMRRRDLAADRSDQHPPARRRPGHPDARRPVPRPPRVRVRAHAGRGRARRRRAAPRRARLPLRLPSDSPSRWKSIRPSASKATSCSRASRAPRMATGLILRCFNPKAAPASIELAGAFTLSRVRLDETGIEAEAAERPISSPARSGPSGCDHERDLPTGARGGSLPRVAGRWGWLGV